MKIEKEIQQNNFRSIQNKAMVNLLYTNGWILDKIKSFVKSEDITPQQYNILRILRGAGSALSTLQIRERMLDKMSDTSRIVERMVSKNLVQKAVSEKDKRMVDVIITPQGSELLENLDRRNEELDAVVNHLSDEELETLNNLLDKLRNNH
jgi:DNA-binding MarR family transcriptional regulator